jgi:uncharacterized membrane protein (UPF0127 family)
MSNKTPKANAKKTKSALKRLAAITGIVLFAAGITIFIASRHSTPAAKTYPTICKRLYAGSNCITLERVATSEARMKGLSDRDSLARNSGMLFVFDRPDEQCFWMKDMRFNIDMVWLDSDRKIIKIVPDARPDSYPSTYCAENTKYVIEFNAGDAKEFNLTTGQQLWF